MAKQTMLIEVWDLTSNIPCHWLELFCRELDGTKWLDLLPEEKREQNHAWQCSLLVTMHLQHGHRSNACPRTQSTCSYAL